MAQQWLPMDAPSSSKLTTLKLGCLVVALFGMMVDCVKLPRQEIQQCPSLCRCLEKGSIIACQHAGLHHLPDLLSTIMFLDFDQNHMKVLLNSSFMATSRLEMISIQDNQIRMIEPGTLAGLSELHTLLLGKNQLSSIPAELFIHTPKLQVLDLQQNLLTGTAPDMILTPLLDLRSFNLSYNHLDSAYLGPGFSYTKKLEVLDLSGNNLVSLEPRMLRVIRTWDRNVPHALNLSFCNVHHIHQQSLRNLLYLDSLTLAGNPTIAHEDLQASIQDLSATKLRKLNLAGTNITDVYDFFHKFQHKSLTELDLSYNNIRRINRGSFYYLLDLERLDLSHNKIRIIQDFSSLSKLNYLDLSFNELQYLDPLSIEMLHSLKTLDLSYNSLSQLDDEPFQNLFYLKTLDLSGNKLSNILIHSGMESLRTLRASKNSLTDLSFVSQLHNLQYLDVSVNLVSTLPANLLPRGQHIKMANFSVNLIHNVHSETFLGSRQDVIDLSYNHLSSLSHPGWSDVRVLGLSHNMLYNLTASAFLGLDSTLQELHLASNQFAAFSRDTFSRLLQLRVLDLEKNPLGSFLQLYNAAEVSGLSNLQGLQELSIAYTDTHWVPAPLLTNLSSLLILDLTGNEISSVKPHLFMNLRQLQVIKLGNNKIQTLDPETFSNKKTLHTVDLSDNPFECDCDLMPFKTWILNSLSDGSPVKIFNIHDTNKYQCSSPLEWNRVPLLNFHLDTASCSSQERAVLFAAMACILFILTMLMTVGILRYKWWLRKKAGRRPVVVQEYTFVDDSSTAALTGTPSISVHGTPQITKQWV